MKQANNEIPSYILCIIIILLVSTFDTTMLYSFLTSHGFRNTAV